MWKVLILLLFTQLPFTTGHSNGICVEKERKQVHISMYGIFSPVMTWTPEKRCCSGYRNVSGTCTPICDLECVSENTEKCDSITGSCTCKPGWLGSDCSIPCPDGTYGPGCRKRCSCEKSHTRSCIKGICNCHPGWTGTQCEKQCDPGFYGQNCTSLCIKYGLGNYICDHIRGDICSPNFTGYNCSVCTCGSNAICNFVTGNCDCNTGYYGINCSSPCPPNKYGTNCTEKCMCDGCRSTDGYCKCQEGWNGTECSEYCPIELYVIANKVCVTRSIALPHPKPVEAGISISWHLVMIAGGIILIVLVTVGAMTAFKNCVKTRYDGTINVNARKTTLHDINPVQKEEHHYETIPDESIAPNYDIMNRNEYIPSRYQNPTYFTGYEQPNFGEKVATRLLPPDYVRLDRNGVDFV